VEPGTWEQPSRSSNEGTGAQSTLPPALLGSPVGQRVAPKIFTPTLRRRVTKELVRAFARTGYHAATVDGLAASAGLSMGRFYELFGGKKPCFEIVLDLLLEEEEAAVLAAVDPAAPWPRRVEETLEALLERADAHPDAARMILVEAQCGGPVASARYQGLIERLSEVLREGRCFLANRTEPAPTHEFAVVSGIAFVLASRLRHREPLLECGLAGDLSGLLLEPYPLSSPSA
jgi:AcrR family transcriptional regulator